MHVEKLPAQRDIIFVASVCQKSEVSDPDITIRQDMEEEPSDKLIGFESHDLLFVTIGVIPPANGDFFVSETYNAVIAESDPVGVSAQVLKNAVDSCKGRLAIDDPFLVIEPSSKDLKASGIVKMADTSGKDQRS